MIALLCAALMSHQSLPQGVSVPPPPILTGHWEGAFGRLGSVQPVEIDFNLRDGRLLGSYRIPHLGLANEPLTEVTHTDSTVRFHLIYGAFEMRLDSAHLELAGGNAAWNPAVTLHLRKAPATIPYDTSLVRVRSGDATIVGTLYLPRSRQRVPLVVVAGGSIQTTRQVWTYRAWADALARQNVAVLVYDRRGFGASTGDSTDVDLRTESGDVVAMVHALAGRREIDRSRIGVMGLSRGGWVAPLAASDSRAIRMLILESAPAVGVVEQELQRIRHTEQEDSITAADIQEAAEYERLWLRAAFDSVPWHAVDSANVRARTARWRSLVQIPESPQEVAWWRRNDLNQAGLLRSIDVPVLALFGDNDRIVPASENLPIMRRAFQAGGNRDVTIRLVPRGGHGLWANATLRGGEWEWPSGRWIWSAKAPGIFQEVGEWIVRH